MTEPASGRTPSPDPENTFPGEPMDREELAEFFESRYGLPTEGRVSSDATEALARAEVYEEDGWEVMAWGRVQS